jgi:putative transposase
MSRMRACRLVGLNRASLNYQSKRPDDSTVRQRLRELAAERRRFGYRRLGWLLAREGYVMNRKKLYRIYREEKLMVRRRGRRKRAIGTRAVGTSRGDQSAMVTRLRVRCAQRWPPLPHLLRSGRL